VISAEGYGWNVRLVNLQHVLDPLDVFRKITGLRSQDIYNHLLAKGWTLGAPQLLLVLQQVIRLYHSQTVKLLNQFWSERQPDMVVSLIPNLNRAAYASLQMACPGTPYITILTDLADYPPRFWMEKQDQYFICGTSKAVEQARIMGHAESRIFRVSGMILRPQFYDSWTGDRSLERKRLGLDPDLPTGVVLFGGEGSNTMYSIAKRLGNSDSKLQLIMICGKNTRLKKRLERLKTRNKILIEGFTRDVPFFMRVGDFFIGKPGPGSISEALQTGLPVIVESNLWTLPQERYNAEWIQKNGLGIVLHDFGNIDQAVKQLLTEPTFSQMRQRIRSMENRAVFEIPPILERILHSSVDRRGKEFQARRVSDNGVPILGEAADIDSSRNYSDRL
jgi:1,2-diacylglycerol 3-beta-galactosyltransferase